MRSAGCGVLTIGFESTLTLILRDRGPSGRAPNVRFGFAPYVGSLRRARDDAPYLPDRRGRLGWQIVGVDADAEDVVDCVEDRFALCCGQRVGQVADLLFALVGDFLLAAF